MIEKIIKYSKEISIGLIVLLIALGIGTLSLKEYFDKKDELKTEEKEKTKEKENKES
jgi:C4-dicarboxylate transporter